MINKSDKSIPVIFGLCMGGALLGQGLVGLNPGLILGGIFIAVATMVWGESDD